MRHSRLICPEPYGMAGGVRPERAVAAFDSASALLRATANALRGKDFPHVGQGALRAEPVRASWVLPAGLRRKAYSLIGAAEGLRPRQLGDVDLEGIARWVVNHYDSKPYPGVVIGSSNGALAHLCAATGMPWLPQTILIPVRWSGNDPGDPAAALEFGRSVAGPLLARNPGVVLHHMHDGNQDELMIARMAYFRLKWRELPRAYREFFDNCLESDAPIVIADDLSTWPVTRVDERHVFQVGAQGGLTPADYLSDSVAPPADSVASEAEWGFDTRLGDAIESYASRTGRAVDRIVVPSPQRLADPVAELMRDEIRVAGGRGDRLLVESFVMVDPVQAFRTGSVPYWTFFGVESAREAVLRHVETANQRGDPYRDVDVLVFPHGVASRGIARPEAWAELSAYIDGRVRLLAGTRERWPTHFDALARYGPALRSLPTGVRTPRRPGALGVKEALHLLDVLTAET